VLALIHAQSNAELPATGRWSRRSMKRRSFVAVTAGALLVLLTSCFALPSAPAPSPTALAIPTSAASTVSDSPCQNLIDPVSTGDALGVSSTATVVAGDPLFAAVGGFDCKYSVGQGPTEDDYGSDDSRYVDVTVVPRAIADSRELQASLSSAHCAWDDSSPETYSRNCTSIATIDGWWYSLSVRGFATEGQLDPGFSEIAAHLEAALSTTEAPTQVAVVQPFDCSTANVGTDTQWKGLDGFRLSELRAAATLLAVPRSCYVTIPTDGSIWYLTVYPGAAAAYDQCTRQSSDGSTLLVEGAKSAYGYSNGDGSSACATDGTSLVFVDMHGGPWEPAKVHDLSSVLTQTFAAIDATKTPLTPELGAGSGSVAPLLGGDCSALLDPKTLATLPGAQREPHIYADPTLGIVGGIGCDYFYWAVQNDSSGDIFVAVAPRAIAQTDELSATLTPRTCPTTAMIEVLENGGCRITATTGDWWYTLSVNTILSAKKQQALFDSIRAKLESVLNNIDAPSQVTVAQPFDCGSVAGDIEFARSREVDNLKFDSVAAAAFLIAGPVTCTYDVWKLTIYPHSASAFGQCTQKYSPYDGLPGARISVPGVKSVFGFDDNGWSLSACATDGISTVSVYREDEDDLTLKWNSSTRRALGELLVPVFAAASTD
jgi:hypothetical protein